LGKFEPALLEDMQQRLAHRGPDGYGLWDAVAGTHANVGLAHRRLSIIDLSNAASQPMQAVGGRYTIAFNGEIYNYRTLAQELVAKGYDFNVHSDTAVLCPLYDLYGPAMLEKLEGMFAFSIWDNVERELFVARDHAGIKPLYYSEVAAGFVFASELKTLLGVPGLKDSVDPAALGEYLTYLWTPSDRTMLAGVKKLRPGHWMKAKPGKGGVSVAGAKWYSPPQAPLNDGVPVYDYAKTPEHLLGLLDAVIAEQCVSDVPLGAFLSGGVDSSAIVASMCSNGHKPERAYCISFGSAKGMASEGFGEDIDYAREVASRYDVMLSEVVVDEAAVLERLPGLATMLDEPQADPAPLFVEDIARVARADGLKVLMSGTGGDDVFTGYRRHLTARYRQKLGPLRVPAALALKGGSALMGGANKRRAVRLSGLLGAGEEDFLRLAFATNSQPDAWKLLRHEWREQLARGWRTDLDRAAEESQGQDLVNRLLYAELFGFLPDHNLNYGDKASMVAGVEVRVPLTDRRILDFMADVPPEVKLDGTRLKAFFKDSQKGRLSDAVLNRSKTGFGAPVRGWMVGKGRAMVEETLFSTGSAAEHWFDVKAVGTLWQRVLAGKVDGAYTILALCMAVWWAEGMADKR
jgi:asparagine synthase (glutamine-hydrolysing)